MASSELARLLQWRLGFIQDGHFSVGGKATCRRHRLLARFDVEFEERGGRFYTRRTPDLWVASVEGEAPSFWMKPSIDCDGEVFYFLGTVSDLHGDMCVKLEWSDGSYEFVWLNSVDSAAVGGPVYQLRYVDGIPVAASRSLSPLPGTVPELDALVRDATGLKEAPAVILDLRSNGGGTDWYAMNWIYQFAGAAVCPARVYAQLVTITAAKMIENYMSLVGADWAASLGLSSNGDSAEPPDVQSWLTGMADPSRLGWSRVGVAHNVRARNDTLLVVLIDSFVGSAGESFVRYLRQLDNVVLMGTNTGGRMLTGNMGVCLLPSSKLEVWCCTKIGLGEDLSNHDGRGYMPDFWVRPEEALDRAVKYIQAVQAGAANR